MKNVWLVRYTLGDCPIRTGVAIYKDEEAFNELFKAEYAEEVDFSKAIFEKGGCSNTYLKKYLNKHNFKVVEERELDLYDGY